MKWIAGVVMAALLAVTAVSAHAQAEDLGPFCWKTNFQDSLRTWLVKADGGEVEMYAMAAARWEGPGNYLLLGAGAGTTSYPVLGQFTASFMLHNRSASFFSGNPNCTLEMNLSHSTLNGTWNMKCRGESPVFAVNGTMTYQASCDLPDPMVSAFGDQDEGLAGE